MKKYSPVQLCLVDKQIEILYKTKETLEAQQFKIQNDIDEVNAWLELLSYRK